MNNKDASNENPCVHSRNYKQEREGERERFALVMCFFKLFNISTLTNAQVACFSLLQWKKASFRPCDPQNVEREEGNKTQLTCGNSYYVHNSFSQFNFKLLCVDLCVCVLCVNVSVSVSAFR